MNTEPVDLLFGMFWGLIVAIICLAFMISVSRNLRALRKEAQRQTQLMEWFAKLYSPPVTEVKPASSILHEALQPPKASRGLIIIGAILIIIVLIAIALSSRR